MTNTEKIQNQLAALKQINEYVALIEEIVNTSVKACKILQLDFTSGNREISGLVDKCYKIAHENNLPFEFDYSQYYYFHNIATNQLKAPQCGCNYHTSLEPKFSSPGDKIKITKNNKPFGFVPNAVNSQWEDAHEADPYLDTGY